ncbi:MAG: hypothetical protein V1760_02565 [Candidatus Peregrinibacteria bacterium]
MSEKGPGAEVIDIDSAGLDTFLRLNGNEPALAALLCSYGVTIQKVRGQFMVVERSSEGAIVIIPLRQKVEGIIKALEAMAAERKISP